MFHWKHNRVSIRTQILLQSIFKFTRILLDSGFTMKRVFFFFFLDFFVCEPPFYQTYPLRFSSVNTFSESILRSFPLFEVKFPSKSYNLLNFPPTTVTHTYGAKNMPVFFFFKPINQYYTIEKRVVNTLYNIFLENIHRLQYLF